MILWPVLVGLRIMENVIPVEIDDSAFEWVSECAGLGYDAQAMRARIGDILADARLRDTLLPDVRSRNAIPVAQKPGALLVWPSEIGAGQLILLLHFDDGQPCLTGLWPSLSGGAKVIAEIAGMIRSSDAHQAYVGLRIPGFEDMLLWAKLPEYASAAGLWETGVSMISALLACLWMWGWRIRSR
ncbi:MAG: hypothetical protein Q4G24_13865 [Paracoccus sp. (in: a-proteobacteria)]|uniref:hypothetical protein n=1 Tax=Paracoccus sp. TaxID=267 RepID=UPI0026E087EE|nr:hypothetical protein [Paracoccus sp. (in: a-proteobacteria)]MDO5622545.1 hypothetical protein [Paracoccus sp. (in: a-proteobacteria)]